MMHFFLISTVSILFMGCASPKTISNDSKSSPAHFDSRLSQYQYPYAVHYYTFESQNQKLQMAYMDISPTNTNKTSLDNHINNNSSKHSSHEILNPLNTKKVVVLLHGKNFPGAYFESIIKSLTKEGYRVIVPDQIGFGKSTKPQNYQYSFHSLATNTHDLLKSLNIEKYKLVGHSMGGMLATRYTLMFPESVTQLFLINPIGLEDWKTMTSYRSIDILFQNELNTSTADIKNYQLNSYYDGKWKQEYNKWLDIPRGWRLGKDYTLIAWNSALTTDMIFTQPVLYEFKNIKTPTVLIIGQRDRTAVGKAWAPPEYKDKMGNYPELGRNINKLIKGSKLEELNGLGHMPFIEDYEAFWKVFKKNLAEDRFKAKKNPS